MFKVMSGFWRKIIQGVIKTIVEIVLDYLEKKSAEKKDKK
jgi:hypothetical protein